MHRGGAAAARRGYSAGDAPRPRPRRDISTRTVRGERVFRRYDEAVCTRGGYCNFMHIRTPSRSLRRDLEKRYKKKWRKAREKREREERGEDVSSSDDEKEDKKSRRRPDDDDEAEGGGDDKKRSRSRSRSREKERSRSRSRDRGGD